MVTGASTADLAVILIDARKGVLTQTRRHSFLVLAARHPRVVLAVNKMDLVGYQRATFEAIVADYRAFAARIGINDITAIPMSAVHGDNVTARGGNMPWYDGPTLLEHLESVAVDAAARRPAVPHAGAVGEPPARGFPRLRRARSPAAACARASACACCPRDARAAWRAS